MEIVVTVEVQESGKMVFTEYINATEEWGLMLTANSVVRLSHTVLEKVKIFYSTMASVVGDDTEHPWVPVLGFMRLILFQEELQEKTAVLCFEWRGKPAYYISGKNRHETELQRSFFEYLRVVIGTSPFSGYIPGKRQRTLLDTLCLVFWVTVPLRYTTRWDMVSRYFRAMVCPVIKAIENAFISVFLRPRW